MYIMVTETKQLFLCHCGRICVVTRLFILLIKKQVPINYCYRFQLTTVTGSN